MINLYFIVNYNGFSMTMTRPDWRIQDSCSFSSFSEVSTQQRRVRMLAGISGWGISFCDSSIRITFYRQKV